MRRNELTILLSLVVVGLIAAFWLVALGPKRDQAASLKQDVDELHSQVDAAQQSAAAGEQARKLFPVNYHRLIVLGKAVPADGEQGSLLVQLQRLADRSDVDFQTIDLAPGGAESSTASTTPPSTTGTSTTGSSGSTESVPSTPPAEPVATPTATEASAAMLPIGASVGPAGLPVMPYDLTFTGGFFQIADFLHRLDGLVHIRHQRASANGRLLTVDGFSLSPAEETTGGVTNGPPLLSAGLSVTTYLTPADQGITAGATPTGPAAATPTPVATTTTTPSSGETAAPTP